MNRQKWQHYQRIVEKELRGEKVTKVEERLQAKGDAMLMRLNKVCRYENLRGKRR